MDNKRYHNIIDFINILQKFMIAYSIITLLLMIKDSSSVTRTFCLLPVPFISYLIGKYTKHIWSFLILHFIMIAFYILTSSTIMISVLYGLYLMIITAMEFYQKLKIVKPAESNTSLLFLIVFFGMYHLSVYIKHPELKQLIFVLAIVYMLLYFINMYLINFNTFFRNHDNMRNVPMGQIKNTNNTLIIFFGSLCLFVMLIFTRLPFYEILSYIGSLLLRITKFLFSLLRGESIAQPLTFEDSSANEFEFYPESEDPSPITQFLVNCIENLVKLALIVGIIALFVYVIYKVYHFFYKNKLNYFKDKTEFISPFDKMENFKKDSKITPIKRFHNIFGQSSNEKIRKHFYKAVISHTNSTYPLTKDLTPSQLAKHALNEGSDLNSLSGLEKSKQLTKYYEKARYSNVECSKEEVQSVKNILK